MRKYKFVIIKSETFSYVWHEYAFSIYELQNEMLLPQQLDIL